MGFPMLLTAVNRVLHELRGQAGHRFLVDGWVNPELVNQELRQLAVTF